MCVCDRVVFSLFFVLNLVLWIKGSSAAIPFSTLVALLALWFGISVPLTFVGAYFGFRRRVSGFGVCCDSTLSEEDSLVRTGVRTCFVKGWEKAGHWEKAFLSGFYLHLGKGQRKGQSQDSFIQVTNGLKLNDLCLQKQQTVIVERFQVVAEHFCLQACHVSAM